MKTSQYVIIVGTFLVVFTPVLLVCAKIFGSLASGIAPALIAGGSLAHAAYLATTADARRTGRGRPAGAAAPRP